MLSVLLVQFAQFIPEEQRQDGVRTQTEIRSSQAFVEPGQALFLQCLGKAVCESLVKQTLDNGKMTSTSQLGQYESQQQIYHCASRM